MLEINKRAERTGYWEEKKEEATTTLQQLEEIQTEEAQPEMSGLFVHESTGWWLLLLGVVAVYFIDYFLFRPTIEYLILRFFNFSASSRMMTLVQMAVPAMILALELSIASQLYLRREDEPRTGYWTYLVLGLFTAVVMPCFVASTFLVSPPSWSTVFRLQLTGLTILSAVAHIVILFGGGPAHDAKAYFGFKFRSFMWRYRVRRATAHYQREVNILVKSFVIYVRGLKVFNSTFDFKVEPLGPFTTAALSLIREQFGDTIFQEWKEAESTANTQQAS